MRPLARPHAGWQLLAGLLAFTLWTGFAGLSARAALALPTAIVDRGSDFACADRHESQRCAQMCSSVHPAAAMLGWRCGESWPMVPIALAIAGLAAPLSGSAWPDLIAAAAVMLAYASGVARMLRKRTAR